MLQRLPELIEPQRMAESHRIVRGIISLANMKRLQPLLAHASKIAPKIASEEESGTAAVELLFSIDASGQANITGSIRAQLTIRCQRCMEPMQYHIDEPVSLAIIRSEKQVQLIPDYYEPLLLEDDSLLLSELVEDELLLALPAVPLHDVNECRVQWSGQIHDGAQQGKVARDNKLSERKNPFAALEQLRNKRNKTTD